jgi:exocyst complex component 6
MPPIPVRLIRKFKKCIGRTNCNVLLLCSKEEDEIFRTLAESVHPVRRGEVAFTLLGKTNEFVQYYEQNRFGEMKIVGDAKDGEGERKSSLSALTGEDVSLGSDRNFFSKTLPHVCASIVGYSAVESALEVSMFADDDDNLTSTEGAQSGPASAHRGTLGGVASTTISANRFRDGSERYERALIAELGNVFRARSMRSNLGELCRSSSLLVAFRSSLKIVHPTSTARRVDKDLLALDNSIIETASRLAQDEQLRGAIAIASDDLKIPMLVSESPASLQGYITPKKTLIAGMSDPEENGLPFGLCEMKQKHSKADLEYQESRGSTDEAFTFSLSVPVLVRSIHARAIACAFFALSQQELGQKFTAKRGTGPAMWVLDCLEDCIGATVIGMKDNDNLVKDGSVDKAVQVMANLSAIQNALPRLIGTLLRGMFHVGLGTLKEMSICFLHCVSFLKC